MKDPLLCIKCQRFWGSESNNNMCSKCYKEENKISPPSASVSGGKKTEESKTETEPAKPKQVLNYTTHSFYDSVY